MVPEYRDEYEDWYAGNSSDTSSGGIDFGEIFAPQPPTPPLAWNPYTNSYEDMGRPTTNPYEDLLSGFLPNPTGNLEQDFYVAQTPSGPVTIDNAGNQGSFVNGVWKINPDAARVTTDKSLWQKISQGAKNLGSKAADFATSGRGIMSLLSALASYKDRAKPSGGGTATRYAGPAQLARTVAQGKYGPVARYAAQGGIMQAYRGGGKVQMEDGGFVLTERAVKGAGGPRGVAGLGAKMIYGPGTGTSDDIPAQINGPRGAVEARLSNGEAYLSPKDVERNGGVKQMYATMHKLERGA